MNPNPGLIPTNKGNPTVTIHVGATVFVNHYSDFAYAHLMSKLDLESTVESNLTFESICDSYGLKELQYPADNGLFDTKKFK